MERLFQIYVGSEAWGRPMALSTTSAIDVWVGQKRSAECESCVL